MRSDGVEPPPEGYEPTDLATCLTRNVFKELYINNVKKLLYDKFTKKVYINQ